MKPHLVCLHGWGMRGAIWRELAVRLPAFAWHTPDLPGYGATPLPAQSDVDAHVECLAGEMQPVLHSAGPVVLLGWSMGSLIAQAWARRYPQQVKALVLVAATPCFQQRPDWPHGLPAPEVAAFAAGVAEDWRATLNRFLGLQARGSDSARTQIVHLRAALAEYGDPSPETLAYGMRLLAKTDLRLQAGAIRQRTLLIHGNRDGLCSLAAAEWLEASLPDARLLRIEGAAHAPFLSHPDLFAGALREFVDVC